VDFKQWAMKFLNLECQYVGLNDSVEHKISCFYKYFLMKNKARTLSIIKKKNFQSNFFQQGVDFFVGTNWEWKFTFSPTFSFSLASMK
jgi:hypothetical protein